MAKAAQDKALADLRDTFQGVECPTPLKHDRAGILKMAETLHFRRETSRENLAQRQEAIKDWLSPLKQQYGDVSKEFAIKPARHVVHAPAR